MYYSIDWSAYNQGQTSYYKASGGVGIIKNPHERESMKWYSWNLGWNSIQHEEGKVIKVGGKNE